MPSKLITSIFLILTFAIAAYSQNYPDWFLTPPKSKDKIYAIGIASKNNEQLSIEAATIRARKELVLVIQVKISTLTKDYLAESGVNDKSKSEEFTQTVSKQISESVIEGSKTESFYVDVSSKPKSYYVLISINLADLKKAIESVFIKNKNDFSKLKVGEKSLNSLVNEIKGVKSADFGDTTVSDDINDITSDKNEKQIIKKEIAVKKGKEPDWLNIFPSSNEYYIGIGQGKSLQQAQDAAINTLVSQIKVRISSEINDFMKEAKGISEEEVTQSIKLTVKENIEDLEFYDAYFSDVRGYWAYYRLNIAEYKKKQQMMMENAKINALDFLKKSLAENDPALSLKFAFTGYTYIGKYVTKAIKTELDGREIILVNELIFRMQKILNDFVIRQENTDIEISSIATKPVEVKFNITNNGKPVANFPFRFYMNKGNLDITGNSVTDNAGNISCIINKVLDDSQMQSFIIEPDFKPFLAQSIDDEDEGDLFIAKIYKLGIPSKVVVIKNPIPLYNFNLVLKNDLNKNSQYRSKIESMSANFKNVFINRTKTKFTDNPAALNMIMEIDGLINKSDLSGQYFTRITVTVKIIDNKNNDEIFSKSTPEIKGGSVSEAKSVQAALDKYIQDYNAKMVEKIINYLGTK